ncbi:hypothetical protein [Jeotgalicoccus sp. ATCC 8456]|uniref:hypothetical protein n=1 Tax=Jeotgalicoccus sp. ATCC 8456 TaxID=946435 RepID=UPI0018E61028|nr:hypothetical protein [Jeotgalicoccus sp. ATCC 8456]QQD84731.1 hypothetical protein JEM45_08940 [Jeotgalicoccus sp. ATCC 8456]
MKTKFKETTQSLTYMLSMFTMMFLGILLIIYIILSFLDDPTSSFFGISMRTARIYFAVVGITMVAGFLEWAVNSGVSRKTFFKSLLASAVLTAIILVIVAVIINFVLSFTPLAGDYLMEEQIESLSVIGNGLFVFLQSPLFFVTGALIGAAFQKGFVPGMVSILSGIVLIVALVFTESWMNYLASLNGMQVYLGHLAVVVVTLIYTWILSRILKDMPVKVK